MSETTSERVPDAPNISNSQKERNSTDYLYIPTRVSASGLFDNRKGRYRKIYQCNDSYGSFHKVCPGIHYTETNSTNCCGDIVGPIFGSLWMAHQDLNRSGQVIRKSTNSRVVFFGTSAKIAHHTIQATI